jgi:predicted nucleic acid-binding protein
MAVVVSDAGPLIALTRVDALDVLRALVGRVLIPDAVRKECVAKPGIDADRITTALGQHWLVATPVTLPEGRASQLGAGERQALALAQTHSSALLLMDDRLARREAARLGLPFIGTVRLLWIAEQRGLIPSAERMVARMSASGYRISVDLLDMIRRG